MNYWTLFWREIYWMIVNYFISYFDVKDTSWKKETCSTRERTAWTRTWRIKSTEWGKLLLVDFFNAKQGFFFVFWCNFKVKTILFNVYSMMTIQCNSPVLSVQLCPNTHSETCTNVPISTIIWQLSDKNSDWVIGCILTDSNDPYDKLVNVKFTLSLLTICRTECDFVRVLFWSKAWSIYTCVHDLRCASMLQAYVKMQRMVTHLTHRIKRMLCSDQK